MPRPVQHQRTFFSRRKHVTKSFRQVLINRNIVLTGLGAFGNLKPYISRTRPDRGLPPVCLIWAAYTKTFTVIRIKKKILRNPREFTDKLLKNILPDETANELKENGSVKAKRFDAVSVLFTDFKGFTQFSENLTPEELVKSIDFYFSKFDEIIEKHGGSIILIKTPDYNTVFRIILPAG